MRSSSTDLIDRFAEKTATDDSGCLLWTGACSFNAAGQPYGRMWFEGKLTYVHRTAWFLAHGEWPGPGMDVDHLCRVSLCCHPDHLEVVTHAENLRRGRRKIERPDPTKCKAGLHDWIPENIRGAGQCRLCHNMTNAASKLRQKK